MDRYKPIVLVILDGWGHWEEKRGNAILNANLPVFDILDKYYPKLLLQASGLAVGLSWMQPGNSEVGHQTLGMGQVIFQNLPRIFGAIRDNSLFQNETLITAYNNLVSGNKNLHFMGLVSDGGVHSHTDHLYVLLEMARDRGIPSERVFIHVFTDGRDTPQKNAAEYLSKILTLKYGRIASLSGRYYAMDRNQNWDRTEEAYIAMVEGKGLIGFDPLEMIKTQYENNLTDEYLKPAVMVDEKNVPIGKIQEGDTIIFFNFRKDRARQLTQAFIDKNFNGFKNIQRMVNVNFIAMAEYGKDLKTTTIFPTQKFGPGLSQILSENNYRQLKIAETEKYAHVTYYFNGGREKPFLGEDQLLIPSKNVPSYATVPEMSAYEITKNLCEKIEENIYDFILVNYANPDMVGHTGDLKAGIRAVEVVDSCLKKLIALVLEKKGCLLITADHGNIEEMLNLRTGNVDTQHSNNPVPFWFISDSLKRTQPSIPNLNTEMIQGMLFDIAPTVLNLFNLEKPPQMKGLNLLELIRRSFN